MQLQLLVICNQLQPCLCGCTDRAACTLTELSKPPSLPDKFLVHKNVPASLSLTGSFINVVQGSH